MDKYVLYEIEEDIKCLKCGNKGAVRYFGVWYPQGLKENENSNHKDKPLMSHAVGFGGTIPYRCLNCGNIGLDMNFEGYKRSFERISKK